MSSEIWENRKPGVQVLKILLKKCKSYRNKSKINCRKAQKIQTESISEKERKGVSSRRFGHGIFEEREISYKDL